MVTKSPRTAAPSTKPAATKRTKSASATPAKAKSPKPATPLPQTSTPQKVKKVKMVRDSITMPKGEYAVLADLKQRGIKLGHPVKKTELIRAGIKVLADMADASFLTAIKAVPSLKTGRPKKATASGKTTKNPAPAP